MAQITVIRDPSVKQSNIVASLDTTSASVTGDALDNENYTMNDQLKVVGIQSPLIAINGLTIEWNDIYSLVLDGTGVFPIISFSFVDKRGRFTQLMGPGRDNEFRIQILPAFENAYKKINLTFFIDTMDLHDGMIRGTGVYKNLALTDTRFKALGELSTYDLCDKISVDTGLGFAGNVRSTEDTRYMYCNYESYGNVLKEEIGKSGANKAYVYDVWVDFWNYLNLCNVYDRVNSVDGPEDMKVWVSSDVTGIRQNDSNTPQLMDALLTNMPSVTGSELLVRDYSVINTPQNNELYGTYNCVSVYEENKKECINHVLKDKDAAMDKFQSFSYLGEVYGDYNYLLAGKTREFYLAKIKSQMIEVELQYPLLGVIRGDQLRFVWFDNNSGNTYTFEMLKDGKIIKDFDKYNLGWLKELLPDNPDPGVGRLIPNLQYSGQYTVMGISLEYDYEHQWSYRLRLTRPESMVPEFINKQEIRNGNQ